jgi:hypothetical protein
MEIKAYKCEACGKLYEEKLCAVYTCKYNYDEDKEYDYAVEVCFDCEDALKKIINKRWEVKT